MGDFELACERLYIFLSFIVEVGDSDLCPKRPECLGTAPGDRILVGNTNDEAPFTFKQLGFYGGNHGGLLLAIGFEWLPRQIANGHFIELAEGLAPVLGVVDVCDLPAVDLQVALAPGGDIDFKFVGPHRCREFLCGGAFARGQIYVCFPIDLARSHVCSPQ